MCFYIGLGGARGEVAAVCSYGSRVGPGFAGRQACRHRPICGEGTSCPLGSWLASVATSPPFARPVQSTFATLPSFLGGQGQAEFSKRASKPGMAIRIKYYSNPGAKQTHTSGRQLRPRQEKELKMRGWSSVAFSSDT